MLLKRGDTIGLSTPAGPASSQKIQKSIDNLKKLGLKPKYHKSLSSHTGFWAGSKEERAEELHRLFGDAGVKAVLCVRGGYGTAELLPILDYDFIAKHPKPIIGYSDITALLHALHTRARIPAIHGFIGASELSNYTETRFRELLMQNKPVLNIPNYEYSKAESEYQKYLIRGGKAKGKLSGGNLSVLNSLIGTPYEPDFDNKILFLEDLNEPPYIIDRMLLQLLLAGKLKYVKAIILGIFSNCDSDAANSFSLKTSLQNRLKPLKIPIIYGFSFGHIDRQAIFPIGAEAELDADKFSLKIKNAFV